LAGVPQHDPAHPRFAPNAVGECRGLIVVDVVETGGDLVPVFRALVIDQNLERQRRRIRRGGSVSGVVVQA
jgi:hypothetical protein